MPGHRLRTATSMTVRGVTSSLLFLPLPRTLIYVAGVDFFPFSHSIAQARRAKLWRNSCFGAVYTLIPQHSYRTGLGYKQHVRMLADFHSRNNSQRMSPNLKEQILPVNTNKQACSHNWLTHHKLPIGQSAAPCDGIYHIPLKCPI